MAFDAGAVIGRAILDDSKWIDGAKRVGSTTKGMTGSVLKANIAFAALNKAFQVVTNTVKKSITEFAQQQKVDAQLNAVLKSTQQAAGLTARELKNMANGLQNVTSFGNETIQSAQNILLTFTKVGKDVFPQATETILNMSEALNQDLKQGAIQVGKALQDPILGITALRRVGVQLSQTQEEQIRQFVKVNDIASAQKVILGELETQFGGSARAARDTLGGAMKALQNIQGDLMEGIGAFANVILRDVVESMIYGTKAISDFINSAEGVEKISSVIATVAGIFNVLKVVLTDIGTNIFNNVRDSIKDISSSFKNLTGDLSGNISAFDIIGAVVKSLNLGFTIAIKLIKLQIQAYIDWITVLKEAGKALIAVVQALINPTKWKEAKAQLATVKDSFNNLATNAIDNVTDIVSTTIDEFKKIPDESAELSNKTENEWDKSIKSMREKIKKSILGVQGDLDDLSNKAGSSGKETGQSWADSFKEGLDKVGKTFNFLVGAVKDAFNSISDIITQSMQNDLDVMINAHQEELDAFDEKAEEKLEKIQEDYDSQQESLQAQRDAGIITEEEFNEGMKEIEAQRAATTYNTEQQLAIKRENLKKKQIEKENALEKKIFEAEKANKIANVWIQAALGIVAAWAGAFSSIPNPIAAAVIAGIMTALLLGTAIAQTVVISQQQFIPKKARGGMASGLTEINEGGRGEIVNLPDNSLVIPNDISRQIANNVNNAGGKSTNINVSFAGAKIANDMDLRRVTDYVIGQMGKRLRLQS